MLLLIGLLLDGFALPLDLAVRKAALAEALAEVPQRGMVEREEWKLEQPAWADAVDKAVCALEACDPSRGDWMVDPSLLQSWRLVFTSSATFRRNGGLSAYALYVEGVETPELLMHVAGSRLAQGQLLFEEPLDAASAALVARSLRLPADEASPDAVRIECRWEAARDDSLSVTAKKIVVGSRDWAPRVSQNDEVDFDQDKAVRVLGATKPTFLDRELLVLRALNGAVFVLRSF
jgi:hypothetical protein